jgi:hypothetical protein
MSSYTTRYKNKNFVKERIEVDGHAYENCEFEDCMVVLEKGETEIKGCNFNQCRLVLLGQALRIAKILSLFTGGTPLKVLDFAEPGIFGGMKSTPETQRPRRKNGN